MRSFIVFSTILHISLAAWQECRGRFDQSLLGYCSAADKCQGTILNNEICGREICCVSGTAPSASPACVTGGEFNALYSTPRAAFLRRILNYAINQAGICSNCHAKAAFLAVAAAMTNDFTRDEEASSNAQLADDDDKYGNIRPGDGSRFRRRGFFGLRGREMYDRLQKLMPQYQTLNQPEAVAIVENGMSIAARQWNNPSLLNETTLTKYADGTFYGFSMLWYKLNGDMSQFGDAINQYLKFLRAMKCGNHLYPGEGPICQYNATHNGVCTPSCIEGVESFGKYCGCNGEQGSQCPHSPAHIRCCLDTCSDTLKLDLGLVIDASDSTSSIDYELQNHFVQDLLRRVNVGQNKTHVGIIKYSDFTEIVSSLNTDYTLDEKLRQLTQSTHLSARAFTHLGLKQAADIFSAARGLRQLEDAVTQVLFVITHRTDDDPYATKQAAQILRAKGIHLVSVAIDSNLYLDESKANFVLREADNYFSITSKKAIEQQLRQFTSSLCSEPTIIMPNSTVTGEVDKDKYTFLKIKIKIIGNKILITVTLFNGNVQLFFSFTNRNPKDPQESKDIGLHTNSHHPMLAMKSTTKQNQARDGGNKEVTLLVDLPATVPEFVYLGVKGVDNDNKFKIKFDDCANVTCVPKSSSPLSAKRNMILLFVSFLALLLKTGQ